MPQAAALGFPGGRSSTVFLVTGGKTASHPVIAFILIEEDNQIIFRSPPEPC